MIAPLRDETTNSDVRMGIIKIKHGEYRDTWVILIIVTSYDFSRFP